MKAISASGPSPTLQPSELAEFERVFRAATNG